MALLTLEHRKAIFQYLGLGEYNKANIKAFQKKYMLRKSDWDGIYGQNTDNTLRTVYFTKKHTKNFKPEEFRCECGGKYCCGYPSYMKPAMLKHIQAIRDHYGKPVTVTCGLRCKTWNSKLGGSIQNSLHLQGLAVDFFQSGVTDPLSKRKASIKWIKKQANHHYTYGNGINSYGNAISASYMGNCLHTDVLNNVKATYPKYVPPKTVDELAQEVLDGKWGNADERKEKLTKAGYDYEAVQKKVNELLKPTLVDELLSACADQAEWMQNYTYGWESKPTVEKSKKKGTCVTYVACVLQRIGYLASGKYVWHNEKGLDT